MGLFCCLVFKNENNREWMMVMMMIDVWSMIFLKLEMVENIRHNQMLERDPYFFLNIELAFEEPSVMIFELEKKKLSPSYLLES